MIDHESPCPPDRFRWRHMDFGPMFEPMRRERGSLKFIILLMLQQQPMHGYALMKAIEDTYDHPISQGIVYPTLQMLEDQGLVTATEQDHKKIYSLTDQGTQYLKDHTEAVDRIKARQTEPRWRSIPLMKRRFGELSWLIFSNLKDIDDHKLTQIEDILEDTRKRIGKILFED